MNLNISSRQLLNFLQIVDRTIIPNNVIESASDIRLEIDHTHITATGTDLENTIVTTLEIEDTGGRLSLIVPPALLIDVLKGFPDQPIVMEINEENMEVRIKSSTATYNFVARRADDYPEVADFEGEVHTANVPANILSTGVANAMVSAAKESSRVTLTGVFFNFTDEGLVLAATDAHILTRTIYSSVRAEQPGAFILPKKSAALLAGLVPDNETYDVAISYDHKIIVFETPQFRMLCRQIEGIYPKYDAVIPTDNPYEVFVDKESFENALKRLCSFAMKRDEAIIKISVKDNVMDLDVEDVESGRKGHESLICQYVGDRLFVCYKGVQVLAVLPSIKTSDVKVVLGDQSRAGIFVPTEQKADEDLLNLVMPLLIN